MRPRTVFAALLLCAFWTPAVAQTSPQDFFGHPIGADYRLPNYTQFARYFEQLARESDRMVLDTIGLTEEGRPQLMAIVSSPENLRNRERFRQISERLARAEGLTDDEARQLAREGRAIIWIDGGLHSNEVLGPQQLLETTWQLVSGSDEETLRLLNDCIVLLTHANPDGMELVSDWYMRSPDSLQRSTANIPRLYQKWAGHDNNRDSYMNALAETRNMSRIMYTVWYPQIMYNHHQTGPAGTVMFAPPFRDPMNYNLHPLIKTSLDLVGGAMHQRMIQEGKAGTTMRRGANYSTWWNGGLRTTAYFHNQIGLLTETIGHPTPIEIPLLANRQLPSADLPLPITPGPWRFRQSVEYSVTANKAVLDMASRFRETLLINMYAMGRDAIAAGNRDSWTVWPRRVIAMEEAMSSGRGGGGRGAGGAGAAAGRGGAAAPAAAASPYNLLRRPENRDPRAFILPADQPDFGTAVRFVQSLQRTGIDVHRATGAFSVGTRRYPAGSFVVRTAQAFRPMVLDLFEPQDHPDDFAYPGSPPIPPYDNAGWTLAYQMGVQVDRVLTPVTGPLEKLVHSTPAAAIARTVPGSGAGFRIDPRQNDAVIAVNRLLKREVNVFRSTGGGAVARGTWFVQRSAASTEVLTEMAREFGLRVTSGARPANVVQVRAPRVGVFDVYGGLMPAGWTRLILETFEFPYETTYPGALDAGDLNARFDVLVFVHGAIGNLGGNGGGGRGGGRGGGAGAPVPDEFQAMQGAVTMERTVPHLRSFLEAGGRVITIGGSTALAGALDIPVSNHLTENGEALSRENYYVPGSVLQVAVDTSAALAVGMPPRADVMFNNSPVFRLGADASTRGVRAIARFDTETPLRSGWAWGQSHLRDGVAIAEATVGRGTLYLFGPEILFRSQPHGTFKLFFNGLYGAR